jgi:alpha-L-arabinofuranosidase
MTDLRLLVLAVADGLWLNGSFVSEAGLQPLIENALNELEFLTGSTRTKYGALRAKLGYPKPWTINYVEIGNEDNLWGGQDSYATYRFNDFYNAIKKEYPHMFIIASTVANQSTLPGHAGGDYHQYTRPDDFVSEIGFFDHYPRNHLSLIGTYYVNPFGDVLNAQTHRCR